MRIIVLGSPESWYVSDLRRAAGSDHEIVPATFRDLASHLEADRTAVMSGDINLAEADALLVRTMPAGSLEQVVFRMDALARLEASGQTIVNPPKAIEAAVDKYLALVRIQEAGVPVPRTVVCQTSQQAMDAFALLGSDVVVKPLFGAEGRGIARVQDEAMMLRAARMLEELGAVLYLQEFVPHGGYDIRALVLGNRVLGMERRSTTDWRTNVSRGAATAPVALTPEMEDYALRSAAAVGAPLAGVDLLPATDGRLLVLEVNAVPGWRALARTLQEDIAAEVLNYLQLRTRGKT